MRAFWGDRYQDEKGVSRVAVKVAWTAKSGAALTQWEVRSFNADSSIAGTQAGRSSFDYVNGTRWHYINPIDPTGAAPSVRVQVGVASDGKADCVLTFRAPAAPAQPVPTPGPSTGALLFADDFNGASGQSFDHTKWQDWSSCTYHASAAYGNIKCGDNETLDGLGHLQIPATPNSGSALSTANKFGFVYGEVSAWIKNPAADGYWPAFWTLNAEPGCCSEKTLPVGELDVMEGYTTWDTLYHRGVLQWNRGDAGWASQDTVCGNIDLTTGFHKYTARVEPGQISFLFDGQPCGTSVKSTDGNGKPYNFGPELTDPNFLILDLAVGGAGGQQNPATQPATMLVDRVEVRAL